MSTDRSITAKQAKYLAALGVSLDLSRHFTRQQASNEIALRRARRLSPALSPVGPPLNGPTPPPPPKDFRLELSRAVTGPAWL